MLEIHCGDILSVQNIDANGNTIGLSFARVETYRQSGPSESCVRLVQITGQPDPPSIYLFRNNGLAIENGIYYLPEVRVIGEGVDLVVESYLVTNR